MPLSVLASLSDSEEVDIPFEVNIDSMEESDPLDISNSEDLNFPLEQPHLSEYLDDFRQPEKDPENKNALSATSIEEPQTGNAPPQPDKNPVSPKQKAIQSRVEKAGGQSGTVQFSLSWNSKTDLDLHVIPPSGERIYFEHRDSFCEGKLDVDRNAKEIRLTDEPVENTRWLGKTPRSGRYTVLVHLFRLRGRNSKTKFELLAKTGEHVNVIDEAIRPNNKIMVFRFFYFDPSYSEEQRAEALEELKECHAKEELAASKMLRSIRAQRRNRLTDSKLSQIVAKYPHTDAAIDAMKMMSGRTNK